MNLKKLLKCILLSTFTVLILSFSSCGSTNVGERKTTVENVDKMFWAINGYDAKGKPATVYLFGTIHVGKESLFPFAEPVNAAIARADRFAAEISSEDMGRLQQEMVKLLGKSALNAKGRDIRDQLTQEQWSVLENHLGQNAKLYIFLEPWILNTTLVQALYKTSGLSAEWGIDNNLMAYLKQNKKSWDGLDELETQLNILTFGTYDEQLWVLKEDINEILHPEKLNDYINRLYDAYVAGDTVALNAISQEEPGKDDPEMKEFVERYEKALLADRNKIWAFKIQEYLKKGGKTFIFAGAQHFCGDESVFKYLKQYQVIE